MNFILESLGYYCIKYTVTLKEILQITKTHSHDEWDAYRVDKLPDWIFKKDFISMNLNGADGYIVFCINGKYQKVSCRIFTDTIERIIIQKSFENIPLGG